MYITFHTNNIYFLTNPELFIGFAKNKKAGSHMKDVALYRQKQKTHCLTLGKG